MTPLTQLRRLPATLIILTASLSATVRAAENAPCYYPGGEFALGFYPCQADNAPVSSCCPAGWTCYSNALCIATTNSNSFPNLTLGAVQRAACTNPKWNNNICGGACLDSANAEGKLAACGDDRFCCENDFNAGKCNCAGDEGTIKALTITAGLPQTIIQVSGTLPVGAPSLSIASTRSSLPSTTDTPSSSTPTTSASFTTSTTGSASNRQSPAQTSSAPTSSATGGDKGSGGKGSSKTGRTIGLAVGIPVGVLVIVAAVLLYVRWWRPNHPPAGALRPDATGPSMDLAEDHLNGPTFGQQQGYR